MAKKKTADKKIGGPFVAAAFFCENILEDMRRMLSIQGVTDTLNLTLGPHAPPDVPSKENPLAISQQLLLVFRSGDSPGKHRLKLVIEGPDGKRKKFKEDDVTFSDPPQGGINVKVAVTLVLDSGGLFWIDVYLDRKLMTRVPINIGIVRVEAPTEAAPKKKA